MGGLILALVAMGVGYDCHLLANDAGNIAHWVIHFAACGWCGWYSSALVSERR
jgi:hypothetical protein